MVSVAAHVLLLGLIVLAVRARKTHPINVESRCCSSALYWSPNGGAGSPKPKHAAHHKRPTPAPAAQEAMITAPVATAQAAQTQAGMVTQQQMPTLGTGNGTENAEPALPVYYPQPGVADRSLLPPAQRNVVVEVSIDALGGVTDERLVSGLGNPLDQIVLATVKAWRFRPATVNGTAVASVEDLVFPFNHDWEPSSSG
ncbi:MAG: TonB family protein [Acidobacteriaceae bacterium]